MSDSMARANSRASVRSTGFSVIIPPVEIDFGGGTLGSNRCQSISTRGGRGGMGGLTPLGVGALRWGMRFY